MTSHDTDVSRGGFLSRSSGTVLANRDNSELFSSDAVRAKVAVNGSEEQPLAIAPSNRAPVFHPEMSMTEAALVLAANNFPVFPCDNKSKRPLTPHGFKDATTDPVLIERFWNKHPTAMIGVPTGIQTGFFAIDPDVPKRPGDPDGLLAWNALVDKNGGLPPTHTNVTPTCGQHVCFKNPEDRRIGNREGGLPKGINVRGEGGYIIMPPSRRSDGLVYRIDDLEHAFCFAPASTWLLDLLEKQHSAHVKSNVMPIVESRAQGFSPSFVKAALESECRIVAAALSGARNNTLNRAAFNLGTLVGAGELQAQHVRDELFKAAARSGLAKDDGASAVWATIESGLSAGTARPRIINPGLSTSGQRSGALAITVDAKEQSGSVGDRSTPLSEDVVASRYAAQYSQARRYCDDLGGWYQWNEQRWERAPRGRVFHECRVLAHRSSVGCESKTQVSVGRAAFAAGVERFARADPLLAVPAAFWDRDPFLLATPAGTVDLRTGVLRPADPKDGITKLTAVTPSDEADCPRWLNFLDAATGSDAEMIRFMQQWCGYALTGDTREHALVFVFGDGGNGKSVFVNVVAGILAEYATTAAMDTFIASRFDRHPTDLAMLRGARLVTASETEEGRQWAESRIKQLTGGDYITARFMRQDFFTFRPAFKLTIIGNHKPGLRNVDDAARRRFNLVPFTRKPTVPDRQLETKLVDEWPAIFRWMIEGCLDWQANGLIRPLSVTEATDAYFEDQDVVADWIADECDLREGYKSSSQELFVSWSTYAKARGEPPTTIRTLSEALQKRGFRAVKNVPTPTGKRVRGFEGIEVRVEVSRYAYD